MDMKGEVLIWMSNMLEDHEADYLIVTLTASGDMAVEMALLLSYILMKGSRPLDFRRPPYCPAGTHKTHGRGWPLGAVRTYRVADQDALQDMKASEITVSHAVNGKSDHCRCEKLKACCKAERQKSTPTRREALLAHTPVMALPPWM